MESRRILNDSLSGLSIDLVFEVRLLLGGLARGHLTNYGELLGAYGLFMEVRVGNHRPNGFIMPQITNEGVIDLPASTRHELLGSKRRRVALEVLDLENEAAVALEDLAVRIAEREDGIDAANADAVERVALTLHHSHLPKMADIGVLNYDRETHLIDPAGVQPSD